MTLNKLEDLRKEGERQLVSFNLCKFHVEVHRSFLKRRKKFATDNIWGTDSLLSRRLNAGRTGIIMKGRLTN
jgi:hypothetical protein